MTAVSNDAQLEARKRRRLRELSRYYCATSFLASDSPQVSNTKDPNYLDDLSSTQYSSSRPVKRDQLNQAHLTALAQLAAFRLGTERSLISLVDDKTQYIVAEATRSVSVYDDTSYDPGDGPVVGVRLLPLGEGVCPSTMDAFLGVPLNLKGPNNKADENHVLITDLLEENLTSERPLLSVLPPVLRYYLDVPLKTKSGHVLGSICVVDSTPRLPAPNDVAKLTEVAKLVVDHFESTRLKEDHSRAQRLLEGLSHFVRGQSSLSAWSRDAEGQNTIPDAFPSPVAVSVAALAPNQTANETNDSSQMSTVSTKNDSIFSISDTGQSTLKSTLGRSSNALSMYGQEEDVVNSGTSEMMLDDSAPKTLPDPDLSVDSPSTDSSSHVRQAFSRASNLIRESMDLDATCFLELPQNDRYKRSPQKLARRKDNVTPSESRTEDSDTLTDSSLDTSSKESVSDEGRVKGRESPSYCYRLGFSTGTNSSLASSTVTSRFLTIPADLLNRLSQKHPEGRIFHFDAAGHIASSGDESTTGQPVQNDRRRRKKEIGAELSDYFPTARSMIFFPLYDNDRQQVYATFLGWTANPARALQPDETVYVSAFANSVMCEVMRLSATAMDKAKSNFISSISHELRSPLHGILAACQLLCESEQHPHQAEFIDMVDTCAHTLLDTMDHVLDYAKINHFTEQQKAGPLGARHNATENRPSKEANYSLVSKIDLKAVIEDTVSSMAASNQLSSAERPGSNYVRTATQKTSGSNETPTSPRVPIILNIHPHRNWVVNSEAGSWRRIIMNLIGNSLKYTHLGHITVDVRCSEHRNKRTIKNHTVELRVTDTGQGISQEYLRHRLYTPFAQENNLSVGTGLGLSMVNQIVASLQGDMQIHSEVGSGTEVVVRIPVEEAESVRTEEQYDEHAAGFKGYSVMFSGFDNHPPLSESPTGFLSSRTKTLLAMKSSFTEIATNWMGIGIVCSNPDVHIVEESFLDSHMKDFDQPSSNLLVVGLNGWQTEVTAKMRHANYHYILPSMGPKRMTEAFRTLLKKRPAAVRPVDAATPPKAVEHLDFPLSEDVENRTIDKDLASTRKVEIESDSTRPSTVAKDGQGAVQVHPDAQDGQADGPSSSSAGTTSDTTGNQVISSASENQKPLVLLVDDNDINLRILVTCVKRLKTVQWITATNGREALDKYKAVVESGGSIPVAFLDLSMPIMDGFESARKIRAFEKRVISSRENRCKIVALTGLGSSEAQKDIDASGFDVYLRKPVNLTIVRDILTESGLYSAT